MKIKIIQVAKTKNHNMLELEELYKKRLKGFFDLEVITVKEKKLAKNQDSEIAKNEEGEAILSKINTQNFNIALDESGKTMSSENFSKLIKYRKDNSENITFVIGGAFGLSKALKNKMDLVLSFSEMTFTHQMIRMFLLEQIYRAACIISGKEYHKT